MSSPRARPRIWTRAFDALCNRPSASWRSPRAAACEKDEDAITSARQDVPARRDDARRTASRWRPSARTSAFHMTSIELSPVCRRRARRGVSRHGRRRARPGADRAPRGARPRGLCPRAGRSRRRAACPSAATAAAVTLLSGGIDSPVSSYMIAKRGVQPASPCTSSPSRTPPSAAKEKVLELARSCSRPTAGRMTPAGRALHAHSGGDPRQVPGGVLHAHHAPVHDAHRRGHRRAQRLQGHRHRREPRPGRQPDHGGHGLHRRP